MKRNKFGKLYYTLPGGGVKFGEDGAHALMREMHEESGLRLGNARLVFIEDAGLMFGRQYVYLVDYISGEPHLDAHSDEAMIDHMGKNRYHPEWLPMSKLPTVPFVSHGIRQAIVDAAASSFPANPIHI